jgi:hypothetical protein
LEGAKNYVQGPRKQQQTWGGELEVSAMIVEGALQIDKATTEKKKMRRPFAILVPTAHLKFLGA